MKPLFFLIVLAALLLMGCEADAQEQETVRYASVVLEHPEPLPACTDIPPAIALRQGNDTHYGLAK